MPSFAKAATSALAARGLWASPGQGFVSPLGTPDFSHLPPYLSNNPLPQGQPWGTRTANNTNYYVDTPNTGVTRYYNWSVSREACSPDGYQNTCLLVNNQFPGPTIEANWGDWIEVSVTNNIPDEGTSIHWHGFLQKATPYMDGVPGYSQCPIAPGSTFTYRFQADLYGTTWWHSHWSAQYGSGLYGPIVVYGPKNVDYDSDLGPILVSDYLHEYYTTAVQKTLAPPAEAGPPLASNNLINGKTGNGGQMATFNFTSGKTYRLRLINPSAASVQRFSIDGYKLTIFANDFVPVVPYEVDVVTLSVGQRTDILVKADGNPTDSVWMRGYRPPPCGPSAGGETVTAAIFYENADRSKAPTTQPNADAYAQVCGNDPLTETVPYYAMAPGEPTTTEVIPLEFRPNGTGLTDNALLWFMANRTFYADYNDPMLLETKLGNLNFPYLRNAHNYGTNQSVRFIFENTGNQPHPMHLHGHNIFILAEGSCSGSQNTTVFGNSEGQSQEGHMNITAGPGGSKRDLSINYGTNEKRQSEPDPNTNYGSCWDGTITNPNNPQRRDVQMLLPGNYIVVQWFQDNPGVWPFHCHIAWHLSAGFSWTVIENPGSVQSEMEIPSIMAQTCRDWSAYTGDHVVQQIDDGI